MAKWCLLVEHKNSKRILAFKGMLKKNGWINQPFRNLKD